MERNEIISSNRKTFLENLLSNFFYINYGPLLFYYIYFWLNHISRKQQSKNIVLATFFMFVEILWTSITKDTKSFIKPTIRKGYTRWSHFYANLIFFKILTSVRNYDSKTMRFFLTPLHIWILKLIQNHIFIFLFNKNLAWIYKGSGPYFNNSIRLSYYPFWLILGAILENIWLPIIDPLSEKVFPYTNSILGLSIPLSILTSNYLEWPKLKLN